MCAERSLAPTGTRQAVIKCVRAHMQAQRVCSARPQRVCVLNKHGKDKGEGGCAVQGMRGRGRHARGPAGAECRGRAFLSGRLKWPRPALILPRTEATAHCPVADCSVRYASLIIKLEQAQRGTYASRPFRPFVQTSRKTGPAATPAGSLLCVGHLGPFALMEA